MDDRERLMLKVPEAAELLGLSRGMAYQMVARGELPHVRMGRAVRVPLRQLREWVDRQATEAADEHGTDW